MPALKYFFDLMSQPSRAVFIFLKINNIPFEPRQIALRKNEHATDEFKQNLNRFQKVPFIHHGDFKLSESTAIVGYLTREYSQLVADNWYPKDSQTRARVDEYLAWQHTNTRMKCAIYFWHKWLLPLMTQSPVDEAELGRHQDNMITCLDDIEELWLSQGHKYIVSDTISVADIFAACELEQVKLTGFDVTQGRPKLDTWLKRVREDCNPVYDEAHTVINRIAGKSKPKL